jgi:hypothetical protein
MAVDTHPSFEIVAFIFIPCVLFRQQHNHFECFKIYVIERELPAL